MLRQSSELIGYSVRAKDGLIGTISDLLFDDKTWTLRWAVVDTGDWISGREVLLPPSAFGMPDVAQRQFPMELTREQIERSPELSEHEPVSRRNEIELYSHYGWLPYWYPAADPITGAPGYPASMPLPGGVDNAQAAKTGHPADAEADAHLRSIEAVTEYYVHAMDGDIGHVEEFLIDDENWSIRYLVIDTVNWWPGKMVLVSPEWIESVIWEDERVSVRMTREEIRTGPEYDPSTSVERSYEATLHRHYNAPNYWD